MFNYSKANKLISPKSIIKRRPLLKIMSLSDALTNVPERIFWIREQSRNNHLSELCCYLLYFIVLSRGPFSFHVFGPCVCAMLHVCVHVLSDFSPKKEIYFLFDLV